MKRISGGPGLGSIKKWPYFFCSFFLLSFLLFNLYPTIYSFVLSLYDWNGFSDKTFLGLGNYIRLLTNDPEFWKCIWVTIKISLVSIPTSLVIGLLLAVVLFHLQYGKRLFQTIYFIPYIISPVAIAIMFRYFFAWEDGYLNSILSALGIISENVYWLQTKEYVQPIMVFVSVWRTAGYSMVILLAAMTAIPADIFEAARIDGANKWHTFWKITVPQLRPMVVFIATTSIINGFQFFEIPSLIYSATGVSDTGYIGGPGKSAYTIIWKFYNDTFRKTMQLGYGAAMSYALFVLILVVTIIVRVVLKKEED